MNFGRAFTFVQEDPEWLKKVVIAALVMLIPLIGQLTVAGWALEITRRVINDEPEILPDWSEFSKYLMNGLKELVIGLVYALPAILIYGCGFGSIAVIGGVLAGSADSSSANASDTMGTVILVVMSCTYCFLFLFIVAAALLAPPATGILAATGELSGAFRFGEVIGLLRVAIGPYVLSLLILMLIAPLAASIGSIACGVGALFAVAYMRLVGGHLFGQAYKIAKANQAGAIASSSM